jgi:hypothetical protein
MNGERVLRDPSQPCEHFTEAGGWVGAYQFETGTWTCDAEDCPGGREVRLRRVDAWPSSREPEGTPTVVGPPTSPTDSYSILDHVDARRSDLYEEVPDE